MGDGLHQLLCDLIGSLLSHVEVLLLCGAVDALWGALNPICTVAHQGGVWLLDTKEWLLIQQAFCH